MEVNKCDLYCPRKALAAVEYRTAAAQAGPLKRARLATSSGILGVEQALRAVSCPQRNVSEDNYVATDSCATAVQEALNAEPVSITLLTEHELMILRSYVTGPTDTTLGSEPEA